MNEEAVITRRLTELGREVFASAGVNSQQRAGGFNSCHDDLQRAGADLQKVEADFQQSREDFAQRAGDLQRSHTHL